MPALNKQEINGYFVVRFPRGRRQTGGIGRIRQIGRING